MVNVKQAIPGRSREDMIGYRNFKWLADFMLPFHRFATCNQ